MKIELKWDDFTFPSKENMKAIYQKYPVLDKYDIDVIKRNDEKQLNRENIFHSSYFKEQKVFYEQMINHISVANHYLSIVLYYASKNPNQFGNEQQVATSLLFETNYEMFYLKISGSFDRFLHLINIMFNLGIQKVVTKGKIEKILHKTFKNNELNDTFNKLINNDNLLPILGIRNDFVHNISNIEAKIVYDKENKIFKDNFNYIEESEKALEHFVNYIDFINKEAIPFLYNAYKKINK